MGNLVTYLTQWYAIIVVKAQDCMVNVERTYPGITELQYHYHALYE